MQFLCVIRRRTEAFSEDEFAKHLDPEADELRRLYSEGLVRGAWSRSDVPGAVAMLEADSDEHARAIVGRLPLAARGMLETQIIPLRGYRGFAPTGV